MDNRFYGLTDDNVTIKRDLHGKNVIDEAEHETFWDKFKSGFGDPMIKLLCAIAFIMIVMFMFGQADIYEPVGTLIAIVLVTVISAKTEMASDTEYRKLKDRTKKETAKVIRNGKIVLIDTEEIVVSDLVVLQSGDKIPADGILIDGELSVDNSCLNGEADECKKVAYTDAIAINNEITGDTFVDTMSLFRGTTIFNGDGIMKVTKVGMQTVMGKMAEDMKDDEVDSPLKVKLSKLANQISKFGYIGAIVIALAYLIHFVVAAGGIEQYLNTGNINILKDVLEGVTVAIVIIVCAVPEGLPLMISLVLMKNTSTMLKHNVLVRKPVGIETAGGLNVLFSDKTGTITKGHLDVVELFTGNGEKVETKRSDFKQELYLSICRNTQALFDDKHNIIGGNATEQALLRYIGEIEFNELVNDKSFKVVCHTPFNSANKFSCSTIENSGERRVYYKGAPEKLIEKATKYMDNNGEIKEIDRELLEKKISEMASKAMRILAFGYSDDKADENEISDNLVLIGCVGIRDDVRPEAKKAIEEVKEAGIQVIMITGDRKETAEAIAKDAGIIEGTDGELILTSEELSKMNDESIKECIDRIRVIARALPTDKSRMVRICQEKNLVVGMTGDGANDAPALKRADVGFAMGSGTDVAKEAGDIVVLDDNFKSIKDAILYGRTIYKNILKFCKFQLTINVAAVGISAIAPFLGIEEPLKVTHLLFVNLCMDALGAIQFGQEPALKEYMLEKPINRNQSIISKKMFNQFAFMGAYIITVGLLFLHTKVLIKYFGTEEQYKTGFFVMFMFMAIINAFNVRSDDMHLLRGISKNESFIKTFLVMLVATVLISVFGGEMFGCVPFELTGWVAVTLLSLTVIPVDMARKLIVGNK